MTIQRRGPSASQETDLSRIQAWYNISDLCWGNCPSVVFPWSLTVLCNIDPTYAIRGSQGKAVSHWGLLVCFGQLRGPAYLSPDMENNPFSTRNGPRSDWAKLLLAQWVEETHESLLLSRPVWEHLPVLLQTQLFKLPHWQASSWAIIWHQVIQLGVWSQQSILALVPGIRLLGEERAQSYYWCHALFCQWLNQHTGVTESTECFVYTGLQFSSQTPLEIMAS